MNSNAYTALIRTFNSERTLPATLASLARQTQPPSDHVFVDSGSTDRTLSLPPPGAKVHLYRGKKFNYSMALNEGLELVDTEYVLIISSHTSIRNSNAVQFAIETMDRDESVAGAYFLPDLSDEMEYLKIDKKNFDGFNGIWNTCAIYKTSLLKKRPFRPEVFSAEDQEWSKWLLFEEGKSIARISGGGMSYDNPSKNAVRKRLNEKLAVALYVRQDMLNMKYLARVFYRVVRPISKLNERYFNVFLLGNLIHLKLSRLLGAQTDDK
jgi:glycosyltransferase involved in cell wall biosynthesis